MDEFAEIERRIELLCVRASSGSVDDRLRADVEDLLGEGSIRALKADAAARRLQERLDDVLGDVGTPEAAEEARRLMGEKRRIEASARRLRARLRVLRSLVTGRVRVGSV